MIDRVSSFFVGCLLVAVGLSLVAAALWLAKLAGLGYTEFVSCGSFFLLSVGLWVQMLRRMEKNEHRILFLMSRMVRVLKNDKEKEE